MDITTYLALIIPPVLLLTYTPKSLDLWHAGSLIQQDPVHMGHWALWPLVMVLHNSDCIEHKSVFSHTGLCATCVGNVLCYKYFVILQLYNKKVLECVQTFGLLHCF